MSGLMKDFLGMSFGTLGRTHAPELAKPRPPLRRVADGSGSARMRWSVNTMKADHMPWFWAVWRLRSRLACSPMFGTTNASGWNCSSDAGSRLSV